MNKTLTNNQISIIQYLIKHPGVSVGQLTIALDKPNNIGMENALRSLRHVCKEYCYDEHNRWYTKLSLEQLNKIVNPPKIEIPDGLNVDARNAFEKIANGESVFITGKAGTGKTYLLKQIVQACVKKKTLAVLAPTGVAAENASGYTMHSFLRLPIKPYLPGHQMSHLYSLDAQTEEVVKQLEVLIIDEISMVRCDMLDAADMILRHYRKSRKPFGGIQVVMFGDLYQLMPVADDEDWDTLKEYYLSPYFFHSAVLRKVDYSVIELKKVYRQDDEDFINLLNHIREAQVTTEDVDKLNRRYNENYTPSVTDDVVTLMTHNRRAKNFNNDRLAQLETEEKSFSAYTDNWGNEPFPADYYLNLKKNARVMFIRNDNQSRQYVNGTMGRVIDFGNNYIKVKKDDGGIVYTERQTWDKLEYYIDKKNKIIETRVVGTFKQYPLKLAWAVTIHKSQGLTFDNVLIDAGKAFAYGQVYVALSRCRTYDGIVLVSKIPTQKIKVDEEVTRFMGAIDNTGHLDIKMFDKKIESEIEEEPLSLWISASKLSKIKNGCLHKYTRSISDDWLARKFFKTDKNGEFIINEVYRGLKKKWTIQDENGGNFPFVLRKYKSVIFCAEFGGEPIQKDIKGEMSVHVSGTYYGWSVSFFIED